MSERCVKGPAPFESEWTSWERSGWSAELYHPQLERALPVLVVTLSRPQARNALNPEAMRALSKIVTHCEERSLGAVVLTGGGGHFIAGGDLKALDELRSDEDARELSRVMQETLSRLSLLKAPVICAVEGFAIGGGAEVSLACDLCVMAEDAYIRFAQRSLNLSTAWGGAFHLQRAVGSRLAFALLARNDKISAKEALHLGLAHRISPPGEALQVAVQWAHELASTPQATSAIKRLTFDPLGLREVDLLSEREQFVQLWTSPQHWEQVQAHWERRSSKRTSEGGSVSKSGKGLFVVFEGIDGAGTTTQAELLTAHLNEIGAEAHFTNEPSEGVIGSLTRSALRGERVGREGRALPAESIALLFAADRADHWHNEIAPRLSRGVHVICDRYLYSSIAYQSLENPEEWVRSLNSRFPKPDLLIYLKASPQLAAQRRAQRGLEPDRYEVDELQVQIAKSYDRVCQEALALTLDASQSIDELAELCMSALSSLIEQKGER